jgi:hypothetical protein
MNRRVAISVLYLGLFLFTFDRCAYNDVNESFNCDSTDLTIAVSSQQNASSCKSIDGMISVTATGGTVPYDFKINDGEYQTNSTFSGLGPGTHQVWVKDFRNCWKSIEVTIAAEGSNLTATAQTTPDTECTSNNGSITVTAAGGTGPYQYQHNSGGFGAGNTFTGLSDEDVHLIIVKDSEECQTNVTVTVPRAATGISFASTIQPIMDLHCNTTGCHGPGTGTRDWTVFTNVKAKADAIKTRTGNRTMPPVTPPPLTQQQIDQIACWVDDGAPNN